MKRVKYALLAAWLLTTLAALGQSKNPYKSLGKKSETLTLTQGKYEEFFDQDSIQQIGTALINVHTLKVVKLLSDEEAKNRLQNEKGSRFLSVDPITREYPQLSPYQYASNRPIDGIDQDGLEYITYIITIDLTGNKGSKIMNDYYVWYNAHQHNAHGPLGKGVLYNIKFYNRQEKKYVGEHGSFVSRGASFLGIIPTEYGNYMGATSLFKITNDGHGFTNEFDYSLPAVDAVDDFAKQHDMAYDKLNAIGPTGLFDDWGTTPVDEAALNGWNNFRANFKVGDADPYNGQAVTKSEREAAGRGAKLFAIVVANKKKAISDFMNSNYEKEALHSFSMKYGKVSNKKQMEHNYQLFLNKYLEKDDEGNWIRKKGMWTQQENGSWTPNKSNKE